MFGLFSGDAWSEDAALWLAGISVKATVILLFVLGCGWLLRDAHVRVRRALWCIAILGVVALPCVSLMPPAWELGLWSRSTEGGASDSVDGGLPVVAPPASIPQIQSLAPSEEESENVPAAGGPVAGASLMSASDSNSMASPKRRFPWAALALLGWIAGVATVLSRLGLGLVRVRRLTRTGVTLSDDQWCPRASAYASRLRVPGRPTLVRSDEIAVPLTWGFVRPVVLMPACADSWSTERRCSALLHELAHIRSHDWAIQMLAELARGLYWFNPLVWVVLRRYGTDRELACDAEVINQGIAPSAYGRHLLAIAGLITDRDGIPVTAAVAMAQGSPMKRRIVCVLRNDHRSCRGMAFLMPMIAIVASVALALGLISPQGTDSSLPAAVIDTHQVEDSVGGVWKVHSDWGDKLELRATLDADPGEFVAFRIPFADLGGPDIESTTRFQLRRDAGTVRFEGGFRDQGAKLLGGGRFRFVADPHYVRAIAEMGFPEVTPEDVAMLAIADVPLEYARGIAALKYRGLSVRHLPMLYTYSVTAEFIDGLAQAGRDRLTPDVLARLRKNDVKPEVVRGLGELGYTDLDPQLLIDLRRFGVVTPDYVRGLADAGYGDLTPQQLIDLTRFRVSGAFIREFIDAGYPDLTPQQLIDLKRHGVSGGFVRRLAEAGYPDLSPEELIRHRRGMIGD